MFNSYFRTFMPILQYFINIFIVILLWIWSESLNASFLNVSENALQTPEIHQANQVAIEKFAKQYASSKSERRLFVRGYDVDLKKSFEKAIASKDPIQLNNVELAIRATLGDLTSSTLDNLTRCITANGSADQINFDMRDACLHFAMLFVSLWWGPRYPFQEHNQRKSAKNKIIQIHFLNGQLLEFGATGFIQI